MIEAIGSDLIRRFQSAWGLVYLFVETFTTLFQQALKFRFRWRETLDQMYVVAVQSMGIVLLSQTFISLMLITEFSFHMKLILRQDSLVPGFSTLLMIRELGPVITAFLLTSRVGAGIAAEIASMKITEQIDALKMLSIDPVEYLLPPRWFACVFASVSLAMISLGVGLFVGASLAASMMDSTMDQFFNTMFTFTSLADLRGCVIKSAVFGTIIPIVASHHGFRCRGGSEGVGEASTSAVVHSSVLIIVADFVLTYLLYAV